MKDKILLLCKRLKQFSLNEILTVTELEQEDIKYILDELVKEKKLLKNKNQYLYSNKKQPVRTVSNGRIERKNIYSMFEYRTPAEKEIIIKGFCLEIPPQKLCELINLQTNCVCHYYAIFRKMIYDRQFNELSEYYKSDPQKGRYRIFYDKYAYFNVYNGKVYVSDELLKTTKKEKDFTLAEVREFKITYSFIKRVESHNVNEHYMYYRIAEYIWRRNQNFKYLYSDLINLLNISYKRLTNFS